MGLPEGRKEGVGEFQSQSVIMENALSGAEAIATNLALARDGNLRRPFRMIILMWREGAH